MEITVTKQTGRVEVTVLSLKGELDGQTYQSLIDRAKELYASGVRDLLLEMADLTYISSAGLVALHTVALLLRGEALPDDEEGWSAYRSMGRSRQAGMQQHIKLLNPREEVKSVLDMVGFGNVFEIHSSLDDAVKSF